MLKHFLTRLGFIVIIPVLVYLSLIFIEDFIINDVKGGLGLGLILAVLVSVIIIILALVIDVILLLRAKQKEKMVISLILLFSVLMPSISMVGMYLFIF